MIGSFLAQFTDKGKAILAAVYLHSFIADKIAQESYVVFAESINSKNSILDGLFCQGFITER